MDLAHSVLLKKNQIKLGVDFLTLPNFPGLYLLRIRNSDGSMKTFKLCATP